MSHTNGPWEWSDYSDEIPTPVKNKPCELVAYGPRDSNGNAPVISVLDLARGHSLKEEDALLIKCAPSLLSTLKLVNEDLERLHDEYINCPEASREEMANVVMLISLYVDEAIARAEDYL